MFAAASRGDGSVVLAGYTNGSFAKTFTGNDEATEFIAVAIDGDCNELWQVSVVP